ncbi:class D beta-lactamase [Sphingomonas sp. S2-65]|uniref:class D beta-lactamase n=1 Tax=Sphingomonas sp. S2-65 TaxID=2903960 RepID=UPI001EFF2A43|nr:class D beta-lactamase [Sphingomonas sp. S2-65]UYY60001.1 class D beta-lactamase [Sphingomonas sp. S2-65]
MDRRQFAGALALGTGAALSGIARAAPARVVRAMVVQDWASGRVLHRSGACATRFSPCSTFKIPLGLMGFDAAILRDAHHPAWDYDPAVHRANRAVDKQRTNPAQWQANSVVWFSQALTRRLGEARFKGYVDRFGYGNRDVRGNPGKRDGLTESWLMSSLAISPDEQVAFLRRMLAHRLVSAQAHALTEAIVPAFEGAGGWHVRGKTGSGWLRPDRAEPLGWFVGWADKGGRRVLFARVEAGAAVPRGTAGGPATREAMLREIGRLAR